MKNTPMRFFCFFTLFLFLGISGFGQNEQLAKNYFEKGEFEKAENIYEKLVQENPGNPELFFGLIATYQQLEKFSEAETLLQNKINTTANAPHYLVELGQNYELQKKNAQAMQFYQEALSAIESRPNFAFSIARTFEKYSLLDHAITAYELGMKMNPDAQYNMQLARLYGEKGDLEKMFDSYISIVGTNPNLLPGVSRMYGQFITDDPAAEPNVIFRKLLLKRLQKDQNILFNQMLSWLFIEQKEFQKAFLQEKAIYRRAPEGLGALMQLTVMANEEGAPETAVEILEFIIAETPQQDVKLQAHQYKMAVQQEIFPVEDYDKLEAEYTSLLDSFGRNLRTLSLQIDYSNFLAFKQGKIEEAVAVLSPFLETPLEEFQEAAVKMALADILVLDEKFNQALIYYTQVQNLVQNDVLAQNARYKVAKTSYYKGDFPWATMQLDVLKSATSQLIANDAMELSLLISENTSEDSTQAALKQFARADLLAFQKKEEQAVDVLDEILTNHKGKKIEDDALLMQAELYEEAEEFENAEANYLKLIQFYSDGVLADNAHYNLAELYAGVLEQPERAKKYYEKIIFDYADSIYFVDATKKFRQLRGDVLE